MTHLCGYLTGDPVSPLNRYTPKGSDVDAVIDVRAVIQQGHRSLNLMDMPALLVPKKGRFALIDYEKIFCPAPPNQPNIFDARGINRDTGGMVILRPDQFVAGVLPFEDTHALEEFFDGFMTIAR